MVTPILGLGEMTSAQAGKFIQYNRNNKQLEAMTIRVLSRTPGGPPATPNDGDTFIVDSLTGDWTSATLNQVALRDLGVWRFYTPTEGIRVWVNDEDIIIVYKPTGWEEIPALTQQERDDIASALQPGTPPTLDLATNILTLDDGEGGSSTVDLSLYLDDTNLARLTSGTVDANGIATFERDDASTFTVDFSNLDNGVGPFPNNHVPYSNGTELVSSAGLTYDGTRLIINSGASTDALQISTNAGVNPTFNLLRGGTNVGAIKGVFDGLNLEASQVISLSIGSTETARFTAGRFGLGTPNPLSTLHLEGNASQTFRFNSISGGTFIRMDAGNGTHSIEHDGGFLSIYDLAVGSETARFEGGKFKVNTTFDISTLNVKAIGGIDAIAMYGTTPTIVWRTVDNVSLMAFTQASTTEFKFDARDGRDYNFTNNGISRLLIDGGNGDVSVNTSLTPCKLNVLGKGVAGFDCLAVVGDAAGIQYFNSSGTRQAYIQAQNVQMVIEADGTRNLRLRAGGDDVIFINGTTRNVLIGTTTDNAAAILNIASTTKGVLFPRMTTTQQNAISSPPDGLVIYNTTLNKLRVRAAGAWVSMH